MALTISGGSGTLSNPYIIENFWSVENEDITSYVSGITRFTGHVYFSFDTLPEGASGVGLWTLTTDATPNNYDINIQVRRGGDSTWIGNRPFQSGDESVSITTTSSNSVIWINITNYQSAFTRAGKTAVLSITPPSNYNPPISDLDLEGGALTSTSAIGGSGRPYMQELRLQGGALTSTSAIGGSGRPYMQELRLQGGALTSTSAIGGSGAASLIDPGDVELEGGSLTSTSSINATGTATIELVPLTLEDFPTPDEHALIAAVVIEASRTSNGVLWRSSGGKNDQGTLIEGSLDLGDGYDITIIRHFQNEFFQLGDNPDADDIIEYFSATGTGGDLFIHIMDKTLMPVSFRASDATVISTSNNNRWRVEISDDFNAILSRIATGDRFILAFTKFALTLEGGTVGPSTSSLTTTGSPTLISPDALELAGDDLESTSSLATTGSPELTDVAPLPLAGGSVSSTSNIGTTGQITFTGGFEILSGGVPITATASLSSSGTIVFVHPEPLSLAGGSVSSTSNIGTSGNITFSGGFEILSGGVPITATASITTSGTIAFRDPPPHAGGFDHGNYRLEADWDRDGEYNHAMSDLFNHMVQMRIHTKRGRNYGTQIFGRSVAGSLTINVRNEQDEWDRFSNRSQLFGYTIIGTPVRLLMEDVDNAGTYHYLWSGTIDKVDFKQRRGGQDEICFVCKDVIVELQLTEASAPARASVSTENAARILLNAGGIPDTKIGDIQGNFTMEHWWSERQSLLRSMRELEETEGGFFWVDEENRINFDSSTRRDTLEARARKLSIVDITS